MDLKLIACVAFYALFMHASVSALKKCVHSIEHYLCNPVSFGNIALYHFLFHADIGLYLLIIDFHYCFYEIAVPFLFCMLFYLHNR